MENKMTNYLNNPVFSEKMKDIILTLIMKKKSMVAIVLNHILQNLENEFLPDHDEFIKIESLRMMDFRKDNDSYVISYLALGKEPEYTENSKWARKNRQQGKIGKIIKSFIDPYLHLIGVSLTPSDIEVFVNDIKATMSNTLIEFRLVKGEDIRKYYHEENYATFSLSNPLHNSCMKHDRCQTYFDVYTTNPDCEMLLMFDKSSSTEKIVGRAIVWNKLGQKYVDRRYFMLDMYHVAMIEYVKSQGWAYKTHNTYDDEYNTDFMVPGEDGNYKNTDIVLTYTYKDEIEEFPYCDTVKYWNGSQLSNTKAIGGDVHVLRDTGGEWDWDEDDEDGDYCTCQVCEDRIDMDEAAYIEGLGYVCESHCVIDFESEYILEDHAVLVKVDDDEVYVDEDRLEEICVKYNDEWYLLSDYHDDAIAVKISDFEEDSIKKFIEEGYTKIDDDTLIKI